MAQKKEKGSGIQQAAGLIRYFDEESEDAWQITKGQVYFGCLLVSFILYLLAAFEGFDYGVLGWIWERIGELFN